MTDKRLRIEDVEEVRRWYEAGWTYRQMQEEHLRKYHVRVSLSAFSELRSRQGWERRAVWSDELLPWVVKEEHRSHQYAGMLRAESRRRAGKELTPHAQTRLTSFLALLEDQNAVVHYDPDTDEGFFLIPREATDSDIIRRSPDSRRRVARD